MYIALKFIEEEKKEKTGKIDLSSINLKKIPTEILDLHWLTSINLSNNPLSDLSLLSNFNELQSLTLRHNEIKDINFLENLTNLKQLDFRNNRIRNIQILSKLYNIEIIDLSYNNIKDLSFLENLINLRTIYARGNQIKEIDYIENLLNLQSLDFSQNQIINIESLTNLNKLHSLYLRSNQIINIDSLENLKSIQTLDLSINSIYSINHLKNLTDLRSLHLSYNRITEIGVVNMLRGLKTLQISNNTINELPQLRQNLRIHTIDFSSNNISNITPLKELIINNNLDISWGSNNSGISLLNNPLTTPPPEIVQKGRESVIKYFEEIEKGKDFLYEAKLLIVGDGRVGKTTLERKLQDEDSDMPNEQETTFGIDIDSYSFETKERNLFKVNIWDFGGQEKYYPAHQFFLTKRSLYILVDDASRDDIDLDYWLQVIEILSDESPVILVQNKKTGRGKGLDERGLLARYTNILKFFAFNFSLKSKEDIVNLRKLKNEIEYQIQQLPHIGQELPIQWINIRNELNKLEKIKPYISQQDYFKICTDTGLKEDDRALFLSSFLHDLGVFLHFQEDGILSKTVILQNEWATHGVYKVLDSKKVNDNFGKFNIAEAISIWDKSEYKNMHFELISLMRKFELCYSLPGSDNKEFIATQLLPISQPEYNWDKKNNLRLFYRYEFMPKGLLSRFIVRMNRFINNEHPIFWRRGVILERQNTKAEIIESYGSKKIEIRTRGTHCKELTTLIVDDIDSLNKSFNIVVPKFVPCNCSKCQKDSEPNFYDYSDLETRIEKGKSTIECRLSYIDVYVKGLIENVFVDIEKIDDSQTEDYCIADTLKIFVSYSKENKTALTRLKRVLRPLTRDKKIQLWSDTDLVPTEDWDEKIKNKIKSSDVLVCIVSIDFLATDYIWKTELEEAKVANIKILPIIYDFCNWEEYKVLSKRSALPPKGYPIKSKENWDTEDKAWTMVDEGIRKQLNI